MIEAGHCDDGFLPVASGADCAVRGGTVAPVEADAARPATGGLNLEA